MQARAVSKTQPPSDYEYTIFISHSETRRNIPAIYHANFPDMPDEIFVSQFETDLKQHYKVWFDEDPETKRIEAGTKWWDEIRHGIVNSTTFIFIITPESLCSEVCHWELATALRNGLNIITINHTLPSEPDPQTLLVTRFSAGNIRFKINDVEEVDVDPIENWKALHSYQFFTRADATLEKLSTVIERHRALFEKLRELRRKYADWTVQKGQAGSYRLFQRQIRDAEIFLKDASGKLIGFNTAEGLSPLAQQLTHYVSVSRRQQSLRDFRIISIPIILTFIAIIFYIFARINEDRAVANEKIAFQQRNEAQQSAQSLATSNNTRNVELPGSPTHPLLLNTTVWITTSGQTNGSLLRLRSDTGIGLESFSVASTPTRPILDRGSVWVSSLSGNGIWRFDPPIDGQVGQNASTQVTSATLKFTTHEKYEPVFTEEYVWLVSANSRDLIALRRDTLEVVGSVTLASMRYQPISDGHTIWATQDSPWQLSAVNVDARGQLAVQHLNVPQDSGQPVYTNGSIWLTTQAGSLIQVEQATVRKLNDWQIGDLLGRPLVDGNTLWIVSANTQEVVTVDTTNMNMRRIKVGATPNQLYREASRLWVFTNELGMVAFDIDTLTELFSVLPQSSDPNIASDSVHLWLTDSQQGTFTLIDLSSGKIIRTLSGCADPSMLTFDGVAMWVACRGERILKQIPALLVYSTASGVPTAPTALVYGEKQLWVGLERTGEVARFDAETASLLDEISVGNENSQLVASLFDGRYIWLIAKSTGELVRIDPQAVPPNNIQRYHTGGEMNWLTVIGDTLWVSGISLGGDKTLHVINRQTVKPVFDVPIQGVYASKAIYDEETHVVWVTGSGVQGSVTYRIDPTNGKVLSAEVTGSVAWHTVLLGKYVWVTTIYGSNTLEGLSEGMTSLSFDGDLIRLDRVTGKVIDKLHLDQFAKYPVVSGGLLWISQASLGIFGENKRGIIAINPDTLEIKKTFALCETISDLLVDDDHDLLWAACTLSSRPQEVGRVVAINTDTLDIAVEYTELGAGAWTPQRLGDYIWIVFQSTGNAAIFRASDGKLVRLVGVGKRPTVPVMGASGYVWIANTDSSTIQRIAVEPLSTAP